MGRYPLWSTPLKITVLFLVFLFLQYSFSAQNYAENSYDEPDFEYSFDWKAKTLSMSITAPSRIDSGNTNPLPLDRYTTGQWVQQYKGNYLIQTVSSLTYDSWQTVRNLFENDSTLFLAARDLIDKIPPPFIQVIDNREKVNVLYTMNFFPSLIDTLFPLDRPLPIPKRLSYDANFETYTGIVIIANIPLPDHGKGRKTNLQPVLFPKFYDASLRIFAGREYIKPEFLSKWGVAAYTDDYNLEPYRERIGYTPYRVHARALLGRYPSDIILENDAVIEMLSTSEGRNLISEGRILIITQGENLNEVF